MNGETKRRSNVVGIFPNDAAIARLVTAVVVETHDEWAIAERRYLSEESMAQIRPSEPPTLVEASKARRRSARQTDVAPRITATPNYTTSRDAILGYPLAENSAFKVNRPE